VAESGRQARTEIAAGRSQSGRREETRRNAAVCVSDQISHSKAKDRSDDQKTKINLWIVPSEFC
jgi:hypothetical protein